MIVGSFQEEAIRGREPPPYLSRRLELPALVAQAAFDAVRLTHSPGPPSTRWEIWASAGLLQLRGDGNLERPSRDCFWPYREVRGRLRPVRRWWHPAITVRVELVPWSESRTSLGLYAWRYPTLATARSYLQVGRPILEILATEIEAWAFAELHEVEQTLRGRGARSSLDAT